MPAQRPTWARATVADVARRAGVSSAVVSYVINNGPRPVAPATAERVRGAIADLNYRPNGSARALRSGSTRVLGLVLPETGNPFFGSYGDALGHAANKAGLALLTSSSSGSFEREKVLLDEMVAREVDAILLSSTVAISAVHAVSRPRIHTVLINCPFAVEGLQTIGPASAQAAELLVEHLIVVHRHRQIAHVAGDADLTDGEPREAGWRVALERHRLDPRHLIHAPFTSAGGHQATSALLDRSEPPSAIFASSDQQAFGALHALHERGIKVPEQVAVVGFDGTALSEFSWPPLTVMRQPIRAMADAAIAAAQRVGSAAHHAFELELVIRRSCGCHRV